MNNLIYYYLVGKQKTINLKNYIITYFFGLTDANIIIDNRQKNIYTRYLLYRFISKFFWFFNYPQHFMNIIGDKLHLVKITDKGEKKLIITSSSGITLDTITTELNNTEESPIMMPCIFFIFTITTNSIKYCIKELIIKYNDPGQKYQHTLENILIFNDIPYNTESIIDIKMAKNRKISLHIFDYSDVATKHINYFIELT